MIKHIPKEAVMIKNPEITDKFSAPVIVCNCLSNTHKPAKAIIIANKRRIP